MDHDSDASVARVIPILCGVGTCHLWCLLVVNISSLLRVRALCWSWPWDSGALGPGRALRAVLRNQPQQLSLYSCQAFPTTAKGHMPHLPQPCLLPVHSHLQHRNSSPTCAAPPYLSPRRPHTFLPLPSPALTCPPPPSPATPAAQADAEVPPRRGGAVVVHGGGQQQHAAARHHAVAERLHVLPGRRLRSQPEQQCRE